MLFPQVAGAGRNLHPVLGVKDEAPISWHRWWTAEHGVEQT